MSCSQQQTVSQPSGAAGIQPASQQHQQAANQSAAATSLQEQQQHPAKTGQLSITANFTLHEKL